MTDFKMINIVRETIIAFCQDFLRNPYQCYTEHGQHALFYTMLFNKIPEDQRFITWENQKICVIQKEYPTAGNLGKPQRQHWDVAILKSPPESLIDGPHAYDFLKLLAVVEFGMNETKDHITDDILRLSHEESNVEYPFIVHLYRLSQSGALFSNRDWPYKSPRIIALDSIKCLSMGINIEIFYGMANSIEEKKSGLWIINNGGITLLNSN